MFRRTDPGESRILHKLLARAPVFAPAAWSGPAPAALPGLALAAFVLAAFAAPATLAAQEGIITYTHSVKLEFELPPELAQMQAQMKAQMPKATTSTRVLHFTPSGSLMIPAEDLPAEGRAGNMAISVKGLAGGVIKEVPAAFMSDMVVSMNMFGGSARGLNAARNVYEDYEAGTLVETHEFLGRTFRVAAERPSYNWQLTTEQAMHLGYPVMKATTEHDSTTVEAWFTPQIPVQGGPASYGGLPGMILVLSINDGHTQYQATDVVLEALEEDLIRPPDKGQEVTREEFDRIVADKLEEISKTRGRGIRIIGNGEMRP
ncbi:MAG: GLPGLI family protein [Gemmatimonadota bacterium]|nr:GLPGLI family protein [Gemmatimonadota bacterium]MDE2677786.1 GLPGLI family protein [Gemmatimonadota bacterium]